MMQRLCSTVLRGTKTLQYRVPFAVRAMGAHAHDDHHHKPSTPGAPFVFHDVEEVTERVLEVVKAYAEGKGVSAKKVTATAEFRKDLGFDSLDAVELVMALEEEFVLEIPDDVAEKITSVELAIKLISEHPMSKTH